eukprot:2323182-Pyramimonas_sp.AAC.1
MEAYLLSGKLCSCRSFFFADGMNVDAPPGPSPAELWADDPHVAHEHDEVDALVLCEAGICPRPSLWESIFEDPGRRRIRTY